MSHLSMLEGSQRGLRITTNSGTANGSKGGHSKKVVQLLHFLNQGKIVYFPSSSTGNSVPATDTCEPDVDVTRPDRRMLPATDPLAVNTERGGAISSSSSPVGAEGKVGAAGGTGTGATGRTGTEAAAAGATAGATTGATCGGAAAEDPKYDKESSDVTCELNPGNMFLAPP